MKYTSRTIILCALLCAYNIALAQWAEIIHPAPAASFYTYVSQPGFTFSQLTDTLNALVSLPSLLLQGLGGNQGTEADSAC